MKKDKVPFKELNEDLIRQGNTKRIQDLYEYGPSWPKNWML